MSTLKTCFAAAAMVASTGTAQAALVLQGNGVEVLDTDANLLWLYDWNSSGLKNWSDAKVWAASLTVGGAAAGEWRLPELAEFVDLWVDPEIGSSQAGLQSKFSGVQLSYWSGTEAVPGVTARTFGPDGGNLGESFQVAMNWAVAVRPVDGAHVPEPPALALALLAVGAAVVARRRHAGRLAAQ